MSEVKSHGSQVVAVIAHRDSIFSHDFGNSLESSPCLSKLPLLPILIQKTVKSAVCSKLFSPTQRLLSIAIFLQQVSTCVILTPSPLTDEYYCCWIFSVMFGKGKNLGVWEATETLPADIWHRFTQCRSTVTISWDNSLNQFHKLLMSESFTHSNTLPRGSGCKIPEFFFNGRVQLRNCWLTV